MKSSKYAWLAVAALLVLDGSPVLAQPGGNGNGQGWGAGGSKGRGAPAPLAAAGLPFLLIAGASGAYKVIRRRLDKGRD